MNFYIKTHLWITSLGLLLLCNSCGWFQLKEQRVIVNTISADQITVDNTGIYVGAFGVLTDLPDGKTVKSFGHCWDTSPEPNILENSFNTSIADSQRVFFTLVNPLRFNAQYYVRAYVELNDGIVHYGNDIEITTTTLEQTIDAIIALNSITNITNNSAQANAVLGALSARNLASITSHGFYWSTSTSPDSTNNVIDLGQPSNFGRFAATIEGLSPATTYYVRAYVKFNSGGEVVSRNVLQFITAP